ncbi:MAG: hypothetical protein ACP5R5_14980 [Armatimonadota bacterium]
MTQSDAQTSSQTDVILRWTVHLAPEHPLKLVFSLGLIALACVAAQRVIGLLGACAVGAALGGSLADFLFPVTYEITPKGVVCRMLLKQAEITWPEVRRCYLDDYGIKLSPLERPSRLEAFRGVYLRFAGNKEQVIEAVRAMRRGRC